MEWDIFNDRIKEVIDGIEDDENKCYDAGIEYLNQKLNFPFKAEVVDYQPPGNFFQNGDKLKVTKIYSSEDLYGIIVEVRMNRYKRYFPLCDLDALDLEDEATQALEDYKTWFGNR